MAEKPLSFGVVSHRIMMAGIECMNLYIILEERCFRMRIYTAEIRTEITETSQNVTLRWN